MRETNPNLDTGSDNLTETECLVTCCGDAHSTYIPNTITFLFVILVIIVLQGGLSCLGTLSNSINIIVFCRQGLKDSMNVGFLCLSLSNLIVGILNLAICVCYAVAPAIPDNIANLNIIIDNFLFWIKHIAYLTSCWITMVISMERCVCVTFPFQVRRLFTRTRCIATVAFIFVANIGLHVPYYTSQKIVWKQVLGSVNVSVTRTVMGIGYFTNRGNVEVVVDIADMTLSVVCQSLIILSALLMINALKTSSSVRSSSTQNELSDTNDKQTPAQHSRSGLTSAKVGANLSDRERKLIKLVAFLAVYEAVCNIPQFVSLSVYHVWLKYHKGASTYNPEIILWRFSDLFHIACVSTNFLLYLNLNKCYRTSVKKLFAPYILCPFVCREG